MRDWIRCSVWLRGLWSVRSQLSSGSSVSAASVSLSWIRASSSFMSLSLVQGRKILCGSLKGQEAVALKELGCVLYALP